MQLIKRRRFPRIIQSNNHDLVLLCRKHHEPKLRHQSPHTRNPNIRNTKLNNHVTKVANLKRKRKIEWWKLFYLWIDWLCECLLKIE
ncbi:hypothetical protein HanIR_Chr14g0683661 [Helianthus annuus]|nr:hypothetical protein HanIR_Chr14g0683661 [Helianthus annuus]